MNPGAPSLGPARSGWHRAVYALLSLVSLIALTNTGWARLGAAGFLLSLAAFVAARLLNRPWLLRGWRAPEGASWRPLSQELAGVVAVATLFFWLGFALSHLSGWTPDIALGRPATVILVAGGLRRWLFPPVARLQGPAAAPPDLVRALEGLGPYSVPRHQVQALVEAGRSAMPPDRLALLLIDAAAQSPTAAPRMAMVLAVTDAALAQSCAGHHDLARAFDVLQETGAEGEALLTYAVRAAALLEDHPDLLPDLPRPDVLRRAAASAPAPASAGLSALAARIEAGKDELYLP